MIALKTNSKKLRVTNTLRLRPYTIPFHQSPPSMTSEGGWGGIPPLVTSTKKHVTLLYLREHVTPSPSLFNMARSIARRQSLRLLGLGPEVQAFQDKCFICQLDLDIASVTRCHAMSCCGKFIHHRCFHKARHTSFQCGHCRLMPDEDSNDTLRANESLDESSDDNPTPAYVTPPELRGPTQIERARTAIADMRSSAAAHNLHHAGTPSWEFLPYPIDPMVWYLLWVNLDWFISTIPEGSRELFIHAIVYTPNDPMQHVRRTIYRLIHSIIPQEVFPYLHSVMYRIRFRQIERNMGLFTYPYDPDHVTVTHIRFTRFWSPTDYPQDYPYTTETPPTPPRTP